MADGHVSVPPPAPAAEEAPTEPQPGSGEAPHPAPQSGQPQTAIVAEPAAEEPAPSTAAAAAPPAGQQPAAAEAAPEVQPKQEPMHEAKEEPQGEAGEAAAPKEEPKEEPQAGAEPKAEPQAEAGAAPPSDAALVARLKELLGQVDLATTTEKQLRKRLEGEYGCGLGDRKALLRAEIEAYLEAQDGDEAEAEEAEEEEEEEEEAAGGRKRKGGGGSGASLGSFLSPEMQDFLGEQRLPRTQVVKRLWAYIKEHDLQDPKDKRNIIFDDRLKVLFPGTKTTMFKLQKLLSKHCKTSDVVGGSDEEEDEEADSGDEGGAPAAKKQRASSGAKSSSRSGSRRKSRGDGEAKEPNPKNPFTKQLNLSPEMAAWVGKPTASRPEITKFFWSYCKEKELQDPADRSWILADEALQGLTGEQRFKGFGFSKLVKQHLLG